MDSFWQLVNKTEGCWEWTGVLNRKTGYGQFALNKKNHPAHRVAYFLEHGKFPDNSACHKCDNRKCVRPDHLFDGTYRDNVLDAVAKGRHFDVGGLLRNRTHCPKGHPFDEANTRFYTSPKTGRTGRQCRACHAIYERKRRAAVPGPRPTYFRGDGTKCRYGHPYDEANTYLCVLPNGRRAKKCRACHAITERKRRAAITPKLAS